MKTRNQILISLFLVSLLFSDSKAQSSNKYEKRWAFIHPIAAIKAKKITAHVIETTKLLKETKQLDPYSSGGTADAFRHGYWMALLAMEIGAKKAAQLGDAHERLNKEKFYLSVKEEDELPDSMSTVMDKLNNKIGIEIGLKNKNISREALKELMLQKIENGQFNILARRNGKYINCSFQYLLPEHLKQWNAPKCLVASNFIPL